MHVNLHDPALEFEPIHRVVFDVQPRHLLRELEKAHPFAADPAEGQRITACYGTGTKEQEIGLLQPSSNLAVGTLQNFLDRYIMTFGGRIDYIHGDEALRELAEKPGCVGFLLPALDKKQLFPTVMLDGALPRKTFSMGHAHDKRFYLECRRIGL